MLKMFLIFMLILSAPILIILALIDILKSEFSGVNKVVWVLVVIFLPFIGTMLYFIIGKNQKV